MSGFLNAFAQASSRDTPQRAMELWRRQALDLFTLLLFSLHSPMALVALLREDVPLSSRVMLSIAWLLSAITTFCRRIPRQGRIGILALGMWSYLLAMLFRGGVMLGFRVAIVTTPVSILLLGGIPAGVTFALVNLIGAGVALWATGHGLLRVPTIIFVRGEWLFQYMPFLGTIVPNMALLAWFTHSLFRSLNVQYRTAEKLRTEAAERQRLENLVEEATEREQQRIGGELHDGVCQELTGLLLLTKRIQKSSKSGVNNPSDSELLSSLADGLSRSIGEIHGISRRLSPGQLGPNELPGAIRDLVRRCVEVTDVEITFVHEAEKGTRPSYDGLNVYRLVQEALANALRHSHASKIEILLSESPDQLLVRVDDNGSGLPEDAEQRGGLGLRTLRWRAARSGGTLVLSGSPGGGTRLEFKVAGGDSLAEGSTHGD